jgi:hypothetical protein
VQQSLTRLSCPYERDRDSEVRSYLLVHPGHKTERAHAAEIGRAHAEELVADD